MPPFVYPPNPPALIEPFVTPQKSDRVSSQTKTPDRTLFEAQRQSVPAKTDSSLELPVIPFSPQQPPQLPQESALPATSAPVVEFYYADPQEIPVTPFSPSLPSGGANLLGEPISVGQPGSDLGLPLSTQIPLSFAGARAQLSLNQIAPEVAVLGLAQTRLGLKNHRANLLISQREDDQGVQEFQITAPSDETASPSAAPEIVNVIELIGDRQEYDSQQQVVTATGNVVMRFANAILLADRLRVNIPNRVAVAEGQVVLQRGDQLIRGERFEYYFTQDRGIIFNANGEIYQPSTSRDFTSSLPTDVGRDLIPNQTISERLAVNQPLQRITTAQGYQFVAGSSLDPSRGGQVGNFSTPFTSNQRGGQVNRLRFQAQRVEFEGSEWTASNVRLTNDPFSPPELEVKAESATFRNVAPLVDELTLSNSRVVFDQETTIPTFQDRLVFDNRSRQPSVVSFGYDGEDRGGLFVERGFNLIDTNAVSFEVRPQYLIQKVLFPNAFPEANPSDESVGILSPAAFGLVLDFNAALHERTSFLTTASFSSLNLDDLENHLRAKVALQQKIGNLVNPHDLRFEYNYRERLFNGSLGFQTVNSSLGAIIVSPSIALGNSEIYLSYQGSIQNIEAPTDQTQLLPANSGDNLATLIRYQGAASLYRGFFLWLGEALPATPEEGLHYTPAPVLPYLQLTTSLTGVGSYYSSGDSQPSLTGSIGLLGQFGHFSRPYFDYTGFNLTYSKAIRGDQSPFFFDRFVDTQTLSLGLTQQVYGPVRVGVQTSFNIDSGEEISTDYFIEYSRRTYNLLIRYNPVLAIGSINLRISDFNWGGNPGLFEGTNIRPVIDGVTR